VSDWFDLRSVTTGLTIAAVVWLARFLHSRWKKSERDAKEDRERRAPLRVGASIVSRELRACADIAKRCEQGHVHVPEAVAKLPTMEWVNRRGEMGQQMRDDHRDLWHDMNDMYGELETAKRNGGYPPSSAALRALATRLYRIAD